MTLQDVLTGQTNATIGRQLNAWQSGRRNRFPSLRVFFRGIRRKSIRRRQKNRPYSISTLMAFRNAPLISAGGRIDIVRCTDGLGFPAFSQDGSSLNRLLLIFCSFFEQNSSYVTFPF
jgi:hypothetical protein